jgi:hypothetical protein
VECGTHARRIRVLDQKITPNSLADYRALVVDMSAVPGHVALAGTAHIALGCVTNAAGQTVCNGTSTGFFAGLGVLLFVYLAILVLGILAAVKVVTKAGYSGWWVLIKGGANAPSTTCRAPRIRGLSRRGRRWDGTRATESRGSRSDRANPIDT